MDWYLWLIIIVGIIIISALIFAYSKCTPGRHFTKPDWRPEKERYKAPVPNFTPDVINVTNSGQGDPTTINIEWYCDFVPENTIYKSKDISFKLETIDSFGKLIQDQVRRYNYFDSFDHQDGSRVYYKATESADSPGYKPGTYSLRMISLVIGVPHNSKTSAHGKATLNIYPSAPTCNPACVSPEVCVDGSCAKSCSSSQDCGINQYCDNGSCKNCACNSSQYCKDDGTCDTCSCTCGESPPDPRCSVCTEGCSEEGGDVCDPGKGCVDCVQKSDCDLNEYCSDNSCLSCDCTCGDDPPDPSCPPCNGGCDEGLPACNPATGACVECMVNSDCRDSLVGGVCNLDTNTCVQCTRNSDCTSGLCNLNVQVQMNNTCSCDSPTGEYNSAQCAVPNTDDPQCSSLNQGETVFGCRNNCMGSGFWFNMNYCTPTQ